MNQWHKATCMSKIKAFPELAPYSECFVTGFEEEQLDFFRKGGTKAK